MQKTNNKYLPLFLLLVLFLFSVSCQKSASKKVTKTPWPEPWGPPANVSASLPVSLPCVNWNMGGCRWDYRVTFSVNGAVGATVERLHCYYFDKIGSIWSSGDGWMDVNIIISPGQTNMYAGFVRATVDPNLKNGRMFIAYQGHDANGNPFSGQLNTLLASP